MLKGGALGTSRAVSKMLSNAPTGLQSKIILVEATKTSKKQQQLGDSFLSVPYNALFSFLLIV